MFQRYEEFMPVPPCNGHRTRWSKYHADIYLFLCILNTVRPSTTVTPLLVLKVQLRRELRWGRHPPRRARHRRLRLRCRQPREFLSPLCMPVIQGTIVTSTETFLGSCLPTMATTLS